VDPSDSNFYGMGTVTLKIGLQLCIMETSIANDSPIQPPVTSKEILIKKPKSHFKYSTLSPIKSVENYLFIKIY
jgi:hypothetical protein